MDKKAKKGLRYADAGVDIDAAASAKGRIKKLVRATFDERVLTEIGGFGGLYALPKGMREPVLVASTDGVGTKLKVAFLAGRHDTVGRDLVNHCVNDILTTGARPLFFLDYIAAGRLEPGVVARIVEGLADACREAGCALIGGETAEMPDFYKPGEYDLAGTIVGLVKRSSIIGPERVEPGDVLVGLPASGLHTNGYSLARKIVFEQMGLGVHDHCATLGCTVGEALLTVHRCYGPVLRRPVDRGWVHALAHITGGGITDNLPRVLPRGCAARIKTGSWPVPRIFTMLQEAGNVEQAEMFRVFNMGVGMIAAVPPANVERIEAHLRDEGDGCFIIGEVVSGRGGVHYVS